jgi:two-component system sensor histidine kinase CiaH
MIKKLRIKFVVTNMIFVTTVITAALFIMCISSYQRYRAESLMAIEQTLEMDSEDLKPEINMDMPKNNRPEMPQGNGAGRFPVFTVLLDEDQKTLASINDSGVRIDRETAQKAVNYALTSEKTMGTIRNMALRFKISDTDTVMKIAFVDITNEKNSIHNLIFLSLLIFFSVILIAFIISIFLSRRALHPVQKAWDQQRQFVADASHELKTPLTVILANLGILKTHSNNTIAEELRWIDNTQEEALRMKELLQDLLFLAREDAPSQRSKPHIAIPFSQIVWECLLPFESVAYEQNAVLTEDIHNNIFISGDEKQIKQILMILLDNACKYSANGMIHVTLQQKREKVILSVHNSGAVISKEDLPHIFERFYRASKSRSRNTGGYGLGLSIAQTIVQNHNGDIKAASSELEGTIFTVTFPARQ